jgi:hypothetical protein
VESSCECGNEPPGSIKCEFQTLHLSLPNLGLLQQQNTECSQQGGPCIHLLLRYNMNLSIAVTF